MEPLGSPAGQVLTDLRRINYISILRDMGREAGGIMASSRRPMTSMIIRSDQYVYIIEREALYRPWCTCDAHDPPLKNQLSDAADKKICPPIFLRRHRITSHTHHLTQRYAQGGSIELFRSCKSIKLTPHEHQEGRPLFHGS